MTRPSVLVRSLAILFLVVTVDASAAAQDPPPTEPQVSDPPAHIALVDGSALLERDGEIDDSPANMPLLAGDRVRTRNGRVEILFADGSTLHLDSNTTLDFQSDELVRLMEGRIRLSIPGPLRQVSYRIDAPAGWAQIAQPGEYRLALLRGPQGEEMELAVLRGGGALLNDAGRTDLRAGERAYVRASAAPSSAYVFNSASFDAFDRWSEAQRDQRLGASAQYLPDEVRSYAGSFDRYGSWRDDPTHGRVWYPTVSAGWRPYYEGRWVTLPSYGWTWVGRDPWAWPTHHYGRWGFSAGVWFWIPGRAWAPAWVAWGAAPGYVSWCPLGWNNRPLIQINVFSGRDRWHPWTYLPRHHFGRGYVQARAVSYTTIDVRVRNTFSYRNAPDHRAFAPRASSPIRVAGTGRAVPRGGRSPVYTNLEPGRSRVEGDGPRVMVGPRDRSRESRGNESDTGRRPDTGRAMPRDNGVVSGDRSPIVRQRYGGSAPAAVAPSSPSATPSSDGYRPGVRSMPRIERQPDTAQPGDSRHAMPRGGATQSPAPARESSPWRRESAPDRRAAPPQAAPYSAPAYEPRQRSAPDSSRPGGARAMPRGGDDNAPAARPGGGYGAPAARPRGDYNAPAARPGGSYERRAPAPSRSSAPAAAPSDRPSRGPDRAPAAGSRPRSGGQTSGTARPRGGE